MQGVETSSTTTSMVILMLAMHPAIQDRAHHEVLQLDESQPLTHDSVVGKFQYLEMVIKETLRLFPLSAMLARKVTSDMPLSDCTFPAGATCVFPVLKLHRCRHLWGDDVGVFDPERFSVERSAMRDSYFYMPFGSGSRNCIAHRYAMLSMKVFLCHMIRRYRFSTRMQLDELKVSYEPFFHLESQYAVCIVRRWKRLLVTVTWD